MTKNKSLPPGIVGSADELAAAIGVHRRTIQEWKVKQDFPSWSNGRYNIVEVDRWRNKCRFMDDENFNISSLLEDVDNRVMALFESLKELQPALVQSLPDDHQAEFTALLDETIGNAVRDAFGEGDSSYLYEEYYRGDTQ